MNVLYVAACIDRNRWAEPGDLKPCCFRSRRRTGTCELSARLLARFSWTCGVRLSFISRRAAP